MIFYKIRHIIFPLIKGHVFFSNEFLGKKKRECQFLANTLLSYKNINPRNL